MRRAPALTALLIGLAAGAAQPAAAQAVDKPPPSNAPTRQAGPAAFPPLPRTKPAPLAAAAPRAVAGKPGAPAPAPAGGTGRTLSTGTGFVVAPGRALTNHHVVEDCRTVRLRSPGGAEMPVRVLASDRDRDLALLEVPEDAGPPLAFRREGNLRRGEGVVTYGFPLAGLLSSGPTLTTGEISALAGLGDNQRQFQISAPVQPGNSGGPLLDLAGNVVGVIVSKLNAQRVAQRTGDIPQNVNFAVKGGEAQDFLRRNGVTPRIAEGAPRSPAEVGEVAHPSTLLLRCIG